MSKISAAESTKIHAKKLKNLRKEQNLELDNVKQQHTHTKADVKLEHKKDLANLQFQNQQSRARIIKHNEEVYNKLGENLDRVKEQTDKELKVIDQNYRKRLDNKKKIFEADFNNQRSKNALRMEEINDQGNQDLKRLQRDINRRKDELNYNARKDMDSDKKISTIKREAQQKAYNRELNRAENKFSKDLRERTIHNDKLFKENEKKFTTELKRREDFHKDTFENMTKQNNEAIQVTQKGFEEKYHSLLAEHEKLLSGMIGKKDKLVKQVYTDLKEKAELAIEQKDDSFYTMNTIPHTIETEEKGYKVKILVNESEAQNISLKGEHRELRLSFERSHKFTTDKDGKKDTISRVESYSSKIPVKEIIDPKTITKSYVDGELVFDIKFA